MRARVLPSCEEWGPPVPLRAPGAAHEGMPTPGRRRGRPQSRQRPGKDSSGAAQSGIISRKGCSRYPEASGHRGIAMVQQATKRLTFEEFQELPLDGRYELVNGQLEELVPP